MAVTETFPGTGGQGRAPGATWQRPESADWFLDERQRRLPLIDVAEDVVAELYRRRGRDVGRFLDLGAGGGDMSALMLSVFPRAQAVLVDFSEPMLARVQARLGDRGSWQIVRGDLSQPSWREGIPAGRYGAVVSSLAIHHLPAERKRALYAEILQLLEPGAQFVNLDYVSIEGPLHGLWEERLLARATLLERERGGARTAAELERDLFDDAEEDRPDPVEDQLQWLREAGFEHAELHFKWAEAAVFGAVRPGKGPS